MVPNLFFLFPLILGKRVPPFFQGGGPLGNFTTKISNFYFPPIILPGIWGFPTLVLGPRNLVFFPELSLSFQKGFPFKPQFPNLFRVSPFFGFFFLHFWGVLFPPQIFFFFSGPLLFLGFFFREQIFFKILPFLLEIGGKCV